MSDDVFEDLSGLPVASPSSSGGSLLWLCPEDDAVIAGPTRFGRCPEHGVRAVRVQVTSPGRPGMVLPLTWRERWELLWRPPAPVEVKAPPPRSTPWVAAPRAEVPVDHTPTAVARCLDVATREAIRSLTELDAAVAAATEEVRADRDAALARAEWLEADRAMLATALHDAEQARAAEAGRVRSAEHELTLLRGRCEALERVLGAHVESARAVMPAAERPTRPARDLGLSLVVPARHGRGASSTL